MSIKNHPERIPLTTAQLADLIRGLTDMYEGRYEAVRLERPEPMEPDIILYIANEH